MDNKIYSKVFAWMFVGLLITFGIGYGANMIFTNNADLAHKVFTGPAFWIIIVAEIVIAIVLSLGIRKMNSIVAKLLYIVYSSITGLTFSTIFMRYELGSIIYIFLITGVLFGVFALIGSKLNIDLSKFGIYLLMALIGIIIMSIINIFMHNSTLNIIISIISILVFTLYIGYDIKVIKALADSDINEENLAIYGAFQLYLDFIYIFIRLLELFGKEKD